MNMHRLNYSTPPSQKVPLTSSVISLLLIITILYSVIEPVLVNYFEPDLQHKFSLRLLLLTYYYLLCIIVCFYGMYSYGINRLIKDRYSILLILGGLSFWFSIVLGGMKFSPMSLISPVLILMIFHIFPRTSNSHNLAFSRYLLIAYLVVPLLLLIAPSMYQLPFSMFEFDSFRGFADSRTDYGFLAGIAILLFVVRPVQFGWVVACLLFYGLLISENRAALLSLAFSILYFLASRKSVKSLFYLLTIVLPSYFFVSIFYQSASARGISFFQDSGARMSIWNASINKIIENIFFGSGKFYQNVYVDQLHYTVEPHNSLLQSLLNFGLVPTFFWFLIILRFYVSLNRNGRVFMLYWLVFGMFHPGFDAFLMLPLNIIVFSFAIYYGSSWSKSRSRIRLSDEAYRNTKNKIICSPQADLNRRF